MEKDCVHALSPNRARLLLPESLEEHGLSWSSPSVSNDYPTTPTHLGGSASRRLQFEPVTVPTGSTELETTRAGKRTNRFGSTSSHSSDGSSNGIYASSPSSIQSPVASLRYRDGIKSNDSPLSTLSSSLAHIEFATPLSFSHTSSPQSPSSSYFGPSSGSTISSSSSSLLLSPSAPSLASPRGSSTSPRRNLLSSLTQQQSSGVKVVSPRGPSLSLESSPFDSPHNIPEASADLYAHGSPASQYIGAGFKQFEQENNLFACSNRFEPSLASDHGFATQTSSTKAQTLPIQRNNYDGDLYTGTRYNGGWSSMDEMDEMDEIDEMDEMEQTSVSDLAGRPTGTTLPSVSPFRPPLHRSCSDLSFLIPRPHTPPQNNGFGHASMYGQDSESADDDANMPIGSPTAKRRCAPLARTNTQFLGSPKRSPARVRRESNARPRPRPLPETVQVAKAALASPKGKAPPPSPSRPPPELPCFQKKGGHAFNWIDGATLSRVLRGDFADTLHKFYIIDCRSELEFNGGHIQDALHFPDPNLVVQHFLENQELNGPQPVTLIFHCEFSQKRGPSALELFRVADRTRNGVDTWPALFYPEVYCLADGYRGFYKNYKDHCDPQGYVPELIRDYKPTNNHKRSHSSRALFTKSFGSLPPHMEPKAELPARFSLDQ